MKLTIQNHEARPTAEMVEFAWVCGIQHGRRAYRHAWLMREDGTFDIPPEFAGYFCEESYVLGHNSGYMAEHYASRRLAG